VKLPKSWSVVAVSWFLEKSFGAVFFWGFFGYVLHVKGLFVGSTMLFGLQIILSLAFLFVYDIYKKDIFGVATLKDRFSPQFHQNVDTHPFRRALTLIFSFSIISWQCLPPVTVLCFRHGHDDNQPWRDLFILFCTTTFTTIYWTSIHEGVFKYLWKWFWA